MGYYIDLKNISLDAYKEILKPPQAVGLTGVCLAEFLGIQLRGRRWAGRVGSVLHLRRRTWRYQSRVDAATVGRMGGATSRLMWGGRGKTASWTNGELALQFTEPRLTAVLGGREGKLEVGLDCP